MNAALTDYQDQEFDYTISFRTNKGPSAGTKSRHTRYVRGKRPVSFNGIHRRRNKLIRW